MSRPRLFGSLCAMVLFVNLARVVFAPLLEPLAADFGVEPGALGILATAAWLGSALPRLPVGWLLTRVDRHHVVLGAGSTLTVAAAFTALAPSLPALVVGASLMGIASGAYFVAANPLVSELYPERVGRVLGVHGMASQLAAAGAPVVVTGILFVADWEVVTALVGRDDWRLAFALVAVSAAVVTLAVFLAARDADLPDAGAADRALLAAARAQWPIVLTGVVVVGTTGLVWNGLFNFYVTYLKTKGFAEPTGRLLLGVVFAAGVPAFLVSGRLADRLPSVPFILSIVGSFVACLLALVAASNLLAVIAVSVLLGTVVHSMFPAVDTYLLGTLPDHHRASAYTVYSASMMVVQAQGSLVLGQLTTSGVPFDAVFVGAAAALVVVVAGLAGVYLTGRLPAGHVPS